MKIFVLAMLLAVVQASPPVPRKTANNAASGSHTIQDNAATKEQKPNSPLPVQKPNSAETNKDSSQAPSNPNEHITIIVQQPTSVSGWEKAYVILTGLLVLVGGIGIGYAVRTLEAIKRQAKANEDQLTEIQQSSEKTDRMISLTAQQAENSRLATESAKQSADAAKASADVLVNSERAWIIVNIRWTEGKVFFVHSTSINAKTAHETTGLDIDLLCINEGRCPAWIIEEKIRVEVVPYPTFPPSFDPADTQFEERYELVGVRQQSESPRRRVFGKGWNGKHAYVYGFVRYRDTFTLPPKEPRITWFGFKVHQNGSIGRILSYEYNRME